MTADRAPHPFTSKAARGLATAIVLVDLLVVGLAWRSARMDRQLEYEKAGQAGSNLARVLAENLEGMVARIDLALIASGQALEDDARARQGGRGAAEMIARIADRIPIVDAIRATDVEGKVVFGRGVEHPGQVSIADRDYFLRAKSDPTGPMAISNPLFGRISGKWSLFFARALRAPDGSFGGIVFAAVPLDLLTSELSNLKVDRDGAIVLRGVGNALIARYPDAPGPEPLVGQRTITPTLAAIVASELEETTFIAVSPIDHREKVNAFRRISGTPFYLLVSASTEALLEGWRGEVRRTTAGIAVFVLATALAAWLLLVSLRREGEAQFRALITDAPIAVALLRGARTVWVNRAFRDVFHAESQGSAISEPFERHIAPEDLPRVVERLDRRARGLPVDATTELTMVRKDGTSFRASVTDAAVDFGGAQAVVGFIQDITERSRSAAERERLIGELTKALAEVKTLSGLLPICAHCKKIRDDRGYWSRIETYIRERSNAEFTHGICPDCARRYFDESGSEELK